MDAPERLPSGVSLAPVQLAEPEAIPFLPIATRSLRSSTPARRTAVSKPTSGPEICPTYYSSTASRSTTPTSRLFGQHVSRSSLGAPNTLGRQ